MTMATIKAYDNYVVVGVPLQSTLSELSKWKTMLHEILRYALVHAKFCMYTLTPQKYSLGYELGKFNEMKSGKERILVNYIEGATEKLIYEITNSEEFERGILKIMINNEQKIINELSFVGTDYNDVKDELIFCEDDGATFYWYNPHLPKDVIQVELEKIITK
jgi:hypothetical protein